MKHFFLGLFSVVLIILPALASAKADCPDFLYHKAPRAVSRAQQLLIESVQSGVWGDQETAIAPQDISAADAAVVDYLARQTEQTTEETAELFGNALMTRAIANGFPGRPDRDTRIQSANSIISNTPWVKDPEATINHVGSLYDRFSRRKPESSQQLD